MNAGFMDYQVRVRDLVPPLDEDVQEILREVDTKLNQVDDLKWIAIAIQLAHATTRLTEKAGTASAELMRLATLRQDQLDAELPLRAEAASHLGEVLRCVAGCCNVLGLNMADVAKADVAKLKWEQSQRR